MVHYDETPSPNIPGGRVYTYIITLQGEWRFTETGSEFSIQFLSKHSMHSDFSQEVACAGEFFVRRRRGRGGMKLSGGNGQNESTERKEEKNELLFEAPGFGSGEKGNEKKGDDGKECKCYNTGEEGDSDNEKKRVNDKEKEFDNKGGNGDDDSMKAGSSDGKPKHDAVKVSNKPSHKVGRSRDPRNFVLIIDSDSGTYQPDSKTLPSLKKYLTRNLPGLKIKAMAHDNEKLKKWKEEQKPKKKVVKAKSVAQASSSSSFSEEDN